jgi:hypothetical protein
MRKTGEPRLPAVPGSIHLDKIPPAGNPIPQEDSPMASLFPDPHRPPPQADRLAPRLRALAEKGVYFGTSSWKYPGWIGSIYSESRYQTRGKLSKKKFDDTCLAE